MLSERPYYTDLNVLIVPSLAVSFMLTRMQSVADLGGGGARGPNPHLWDKETLEATPIFRNF